MIQLQPPPREYVINQFISRIPWTRLRVRGYARLGVRFESPDESTILMGTDVHAPRQISVGANSVIGRRCLLDGRGGLEIGRNVNVSSYTLLITASHDVRSANFAGYTMPIKIEDRVWIATGATILPGVTLGSGSVVAAGAVVTSNVEPRAVVGGVPARKIGERPNNLDYELSYNRDYI